jgi:hypothetical protein
VLGCRPSAAASQEQSFSRLTGNINSTTREFHRA